MTVSMRMKAMKTMPFCKKCRKNNPKDEHYYLRTKQLPVWYSDAGIAQNTVPSELDNLTMAEKLLIQKISPFVPLEHIHQGVMGLNGHVCSFEQDITGICLELPKLPSDVTVIRIVKEMKAEIGKSDLSVKKAYKVNRKRVLSALRWLKKYNREYTDIVIKEDNLAWMGGEEGELCPPVDIEDEDMFMAQNNNPGDTDFGPSGVPPEQPPVQEFGYVDNGVLDHPTEQIANQKIELLRTVHAHGKKRMVQVAWPATGEKAVSEYSTDRIFAGAFPWLFPGGYGDLVDAPKTSERDWGSRMLYHWDGRFLRDPVFTFYANNYITRHQNASTGKWFIDSFHNNAPETLEDLKESIREGDLGFINTLTYSSNRVKGSPQYWFKKRSELYAWVNHHVEAGNGSPSFFVTLSCAEHHWPDIVRLIKERMEIAGQDTKDCYVGSPKLSRILNEYTVVVQEFFQARVEAWFKTVGKSVFDVEHHWIRYEFAPGRGQIHAHILCISKDKQLRKLTNIAGIDQPGVTKLADYMRDKYGFVANASDDENTSKTTPMSVRFSDVVPEQRQSDSNSLLNKCQMHKCSRFCMRKGVCKVGCGKETEKNKCDTPGFAMREGDAVEKDHRGITKMFLAREHKRVNQTPAHALQSWRGNCDVQVLLYKSKPGELDIAEVAQVVDYIIAYSCKGNATLKEELTQTRNLVMYSTELTGCQRDVQRVCRQVLNKAASSRLISKQEATVMLANLPFTYSTETVENVSVSSTKSIGDVACGENSELIVPSYKNRLDKITPSSPLHEFLRCLSLYDYFLLIKNVLPPSKNKHKNTKKFLAMHEAEGGNKSLLQYFVSLKYKKHPKARNYIIPSFVGIKTKPCFPITDPYARAVITIYRPWTELPSPSTDWKHPFHVFINSRYCPKSVQLAHMRVVQRHYQKTTFLEPKHSSVDHTNNVVSEDDLETMELLGMQAGDDGGDDLNVRHLPKGEDFNWNRPQLTRFPAPSEADVPPQDWIKHKTDQLEATAAVLQVPMRDDGKPYSIEALYGDQQKILLIVIDKVKEWMSCRNLRTFKPLHMTINGPGGSGKSVLIQTIVSVLRTVFQTNGVAQVAAPTGSAAFNVNGETLHRLVAMGIAEEESLSEAKKTKLIDKFSDLLCLIIDERSLLSATDLGRAEMRIRNTIHNSFGNLDQYFGGLPVVLLVGDDYQLPAQDGIIQNLDKDKLRGETGRGIEVLRECAMKVMHLSTSRRMADTQLEQKMLMQKVRLGTRMKFRHIAHFRLVPKYA